jgi:hypothetical protein
VTVPAFIEHDFDPTVLFSGANDRCTFYAKKVSIFRPDASHETIQQILIGDRRNLNVVGFFKMGFRRRDPRAPG